MNGLGYLPDRPDARDLVAEPHLAMTAPLVPERAPKNPNVQTLDQGGLGSCTANAAGQAVRADQMRQVVAAGMSPAEAQRRLPFPSRLFAYRMALGMDGGPIEDLGTYIRHIFKVYNDLGFPPEHVWTYSDDTGPTGKFRKNPSSEAFREAFDQKQLAKNGGNPLVVYRRIVSTGYARADEIKRAHGAQKLVVFGTHVSRNFVADRSANGMKPIDPPIGQSIAGGHAMVTGGHDSAGVDVLNSWGWGYGDAGWCRFSWDYITWANTFDLWVVDTAPLYLS